MTSVKERKTWPWSGPGDPLTQRQQEIFDYIVGQIKEHGGPPSIREIMVFIGSKAPNGVMCHIRALEKKGRIVRGPEGQSRSIRIVGSHACPCCGHVKEVEPDA